MVNGTIYYVIGFSPFPWTLTALRSRVTSSAAATVVRRLILSCDSSQMPVAVLYQDTFDASSTGAKDTTGLSQLVPAGPYLMGVRAEGGAPTIALVGPIAQFQRSNMVSGESGPAEGFLKASSGTGTVTTPPVPNTLWGSANSAGAGFSGRWTV